MNTSIYQITFLRHGQSVGNAEGRFQGQADFPLTGLGQEQARRLALRWKNQARYFDKVISSPLLRARQTAEIICQALQRPLEFNSLWMERNNGKLAGLTDQEANTRYPKPDFIDLYTPIGRTGESQWQTYLRAGQALQSLLCRPPGSYLVVAHGGILNMALYAILSIPLPENFRGPRFRLGNTGFADLSYHPQSGIWRLLRLETPEEGAEG